MSQDITAFLAKLIPPIITGLGAWIIATRNDGTSRENVYAEHTKEMWDRLDSVTSKLEKVTHERDDLKNQIEDMRDQISEQSQIIEKQNRTIEQLSESVDKLQESMEGKHE